VSKETKKPNKEFELAVQDIRTRMAQIRVLFKNPLVTVVIRNPDLENGDMVMTDEPDGLDLVKNSITAAQERIKNGN